MASSMQEGYQAAKRISIVILGGLLLGFGFLELEALAGISSGILVLPTILLAMFLVWLVVAELELLEGIGI